AGPANRVDTRIVANASFRSRSKTTSVDVRTDGSVSMLLIRIAGQHDTRGKILTAGNKPVQCGAVRGRRCVRRCLRGTDAEAGEAGKFPITKDLSADR